MHASGRMGRAQGVDGSRPTDDARVIELGFAVERGRGTRSQEGEQEEGDHAGDELDGGGVVVVVKGRMEVLVK